MFRDECRQSTFLVAVGIVASLFFSIRLLIAILQGIRLYVLAPLFPVDLKKFGRWAVVTGATDGIGKAYVIQLARRGLDVMLVGRNQEKLKNCVRELKELGVATDTVLVDFGRGSEIYPLFQQKLIGKDIGLLVNNVGTLLRYPCFFLDLEDRELVELILINVLSVVATTRIALPSMLENGRGCVVNVASVSGLRPLPLKSTYSASKAFVVSLSEALSVEYREKGVIFQALVPGYVSTKLVQFSRYLQKRSTFVPDARTYARSAIHTLTRSRTAAGYWTHELQRYVTDTLPSFLWNWSSVFVQVNLDSRKKQ